MIFFTADLHLGHKNIIKHCNRPFSDVDAMNKKIIDNWNSVVTYKDSVYILGDFIWDFRIEVAKTYIDAMKFKRIYVIPGNHDSRKLIVGLGERVFCLGGLEEITFYNQRIILCHYPLITWNKRSYGTWQLFGHVHGRQINISKNQMDVGVDTNNYFPYSFNQIKERLNEDFDKEDGEDCP